MNEELTLLQTVLIAIVEGLTEFLPVSSTGHMIIAQNLLGVESTPFVKAFTVIIQFGAILAVVWLYWQRFFSLNPCKIFDKEAIQGVSTTKKWLTYLKRFIYKYDFYWKLFVAFLPAAFFGLLFSDKIDDLLESVQVVAIMLILGGIFMIFSDWIFRNQKQEDKMTDKKAFKIGLYQCIAMIPGVSRSMATIMGGMAQKLSRKHAAEFSFFLAVPTMFAATCYKILQLFLKEGVDVLVDNLYTLLIGNVVAFIVSLLAIKFFINYITKYGFKAFGFYRVIVGALILGMLYFGYSLEIA